MKDTSLDLGTMIEDIIVAPLRSELRAERNLRISAEDTAQKAHLRIEELSAALDGALADRYFYWQAYINQHHEISRLKREFAEYVEAHP